MAAENQSGGPDSKKVATVLKSAHTKAEAPVVPSIGLKLRQQGTGSSAHAFGPQDESLAEACPLPRQSSGAVGSAPQKHHY